MAVNLDKPQRWKEGISKSVDMYNDWFMRFAPDAFRATRFLTTEAVERTLKDTDNLINICPDILRLHPEVLSTLRMSTCPPLAVDRLIGLAGVPPAMVKRMEKEKVLPAQMSPARLDAELGKITALIKRMADPDIFVWLGRAVPPTEAEIRRAATIVADRLCGSVANPIIRNAQEIRQLAAIREMTLLSLASEMTEYSATIEAQRLVLQAALDGQKTQKERNRLGQFATPTLLARDMLGYGLSLLAAASPIRFLDPAFGTGSFYSALLATATARHIQKAYGFEIDAHYEAPARALWADTSLSIERTDFTQALPPTREPERFNLLVCNPPYVRHHHLANSEKIRLQESTRAVFGAKIDGLAGLYCYFLALAHLWMQSGAVGIWLIPSEFMNVNYGRAVKHYLLNKVTLLRIHRFDPDNVQFDDALVSSAVVCFRNARPHPGHVVEFSYGGTLADPVSSKQIFADALCREAKWTRFPLADVREAVRGPILGDYFRIKRGIVTGDNGFFIFTPERMETLGLPPECFRPILPSPRYLEADEIASDSDGNPLLERRLFLLDRRLREDEVKVSYPALWNYLQTGKLEVSGRYLCSKRNPWYSQEERPHTPFICTYIGRNGTKRGKPFRFILNHSRATAANVYLLLYPKPDLAHALAANPSLVRKVWEWLNTIHPDELLDEGRVYGGGLHKLEPSELAKVRADGVQALLSANTLPSVQHSLFDAVV